MSDAHARRSDPVSSHQAVHLITRDTPLQEAIVRQAWAWRLVWLHNLRETPHWTDGEMWEALEARLGRRLQRNIIARARVRLEQLDNAPLERSPWPTVIDGRQLVTFHATRHAATWLANTRRG